MPNSRRQSAVECQPNPSSNLETSALPHQPTSTSSRLESSINRKFHSLGSPAKAINASTPSRNSISRAAVSSELKSLPKNDNLTRPEATIGSQDRASSLTQPKKHNRAPTGLGLPPSITSSIPAKRNLTTSDIPQSISQKKNKPEIEAQPKIERNNSLPADTLRCHQCRAEVHVENIIMCSNEEFARSISRKRKSEPIQIPSTSTNANNSTSGAKTPSVILGPCRTSFCGRCLLARYGEDLKKLRPAVKAPYKWDCPVCKDYCNCSICRKKKGLPPTGKLAKVAIEAGFLSAHELLTVNPNAQGADMLIQEANRREKAKIQSSLVSDQIQGSDQPQAPDQPQVFDQPQAKPDASNKKLMKQKNSESSIPKDKKLTNKPITKNTHKKKMSSQDPKHLEVVKKLKKQQQVGKSKAQKPEPSTSNQTSSSSTPAPAPLRMEKKVNEPPAAEVNKVPIRRSPHVVQAPTSYSCLPTGVLGSGQILRRLHVREFVCRFKDLIPGLGGTENKNSKTETQRAEKIIDSMDDLLNFWTDDEGGMRAIMNGLARLIELDFDVEDQSTERGSQILKSSQSPPILAQLKRECKNSATPMPYHQNSVPCWLTATSLLKEEGLESLFEKDIETPYISSIDGSPSDELPNDERLQRVKFSPVKKLAIICGLIDIALRGHTLCEDLIQGLEREKQAKADIVKERSKLNKKWSETKAKKVAEMPSKKSLLITSDDGQPILKPSKSLLDQETARVQNLTEWEADMSQAEKAHKDEMRISCIDQYKVESSDRLRFQSIGQDPRNNTYYILSSTPGILYPNDPNELAYAWSYSLIIHGSEPTNSIVKGKKRAQQQKKAQDTATTTSNNSPMIAQTDEKEDAQFDMLEGGQRSPNDQWIRISDPKQIRQLASWIEYEAKLVDFKNSTRGPSSNGVNKLAPLSNPTAKQIVTQAQGGSGGLNENTSNNGVANDNCLKSVLNLVEQINRFSEFLELKINQHLELVHNDRRGLKSRNHS
ncbi:hypothetical protein MJO28_012229 [Puccinia striiformis f. sp. tritici]|uniref:Zinc-finger domain-containing protein n=5 Tax=Puccinia striiformis f. sp. tritici TaxID=168172 RepID=A0A0L0UWD1_9BASI|nr:hypothetical protein MJO28_012229 [Puccinia striiformis f. sp. tritici]KNE91330.1 hypothetical protein PSTG_15260 [Puccinia striiformis f. sp. tritici PST-78]